MIDKWYVPAFKDLAPVSPLNAVLRDPAFAGNLQVLPTVGGLLVGALGE
jgi:hypothetical protein